MEKSGLFNSSGGDRIYKAEDFANYFGKLVSNGIFYGHDALKVTASEGMYLLVNEGSGWINGYYYENTNARELQINIANGVNPRIDRIVLRLNMVERRIRIYTLTGVAAPMPEPPELTRTSDIYELCLAEIHIPRGAAELEPDNIRDTRINSELCGIVNSLITAVYE